MCSSDLSLMQAAKNKPDKLVTAYRAVPLQNAEKVKRLEKQIDAYMKRRIVPAEWGGQRKQIGDEKGFYDYATAELARLKSLPHENKIGINNGDWVTINKAYAKEHGESSLGGNYKIVSKKVPARKLFTEANSVHEFGYDESGFADPRLLAAIGLGSAGLLALSQDDR